MSCNVFVGSQDGTVHVWSADTGEKITVLDGGHPGPTHCVQFNPKLMMMASACTSMVSSHNIMHPVYRKGPWSKAYSAEFRNVTQSYVKINILLCP